MFAAVAEGLAQSGSAKDARVVVEKPFGRDLESEVGEGELRRDPQVGHAPG
jgi:glucose-6-phosphate 1-dehydrogenase